MGDPGENGGANEIAFEAYGVRLAVSASQPEVLDRIRQFVPPGAQACPADTVEARFSLTGNELGTYTLNRDGKPLVDTPKGLQLDLALDVLDSEVRIWIGRKAPEAIFVHAGVVAHRGMAIVMPGPSFGGKTTLVAALVRAGAVYYSDEFAVIDRDSLVNAYAKPLSIRGNGWKQTEHAVESIGGVAGEERLPLGMIVITTYRPDATWSPERRSAGAGAMSLLANAVPARERSGEVMEAISQAATGAVVIESDRGEADAIAPLLLAELERHLA